MRVSNGEKLKSYRKVLTLSASVMLPFVAKPAYAHTLPQPNNFTTHPLYDSRFHATNSIHLNLNALLPANSQATFALRSTGLSGLPPATQAVAVDLSSASRNISLGSQLFPHGGSITISVGGNSQTFRGGDQVTAAEYLAIKEVSSGGAQTIKISQSGTADGGTFSLSSLSSLKVDELTIPQSVTAYDNFSNSKSFAVSGNILNYGNLYGVGAAHTSSVGTISGTDIINEVGGVISTQPLINAAQSSRAGASLVSLTLSASDSITNYGTINTSGSTNLLLGSGSLINAGQVISTSGNINISAPDRATNINVAGSGGTLQALGGDINIRSGSYSGSANVNLQGGNYLSQNLNIFSGDGAVTSNVGIVTGVVNTVGNSAHEFADTANLTLGSNVLKGDPTFVNTGGNIIINGGVVASEAITILASGSILGIGDAYISTAHATGVSATAAAGDITLVAGATVTSSGASSSALPGAPIGTGNTATVSFASGNGGSVDFSKSTHSGAIITSSSTLSGNGNQQQDAGNVTIVAFGTNATNGQILFPTKVGSISATSEYGKGGDVTLLAGQVGSSTKPAISVGTIATGTDSTLGTTNGSVVIESAQVASSDTATYNSAGALTAGSITPSASLGLGSILINGNISAGSANASKSSVTIETSGAGTITEAGAGTIISAPILVLSNQLAGIGKSATTAFATETQNLTVNTQGNVYIKNTAAVYLNASTFGNSTLKSATFSLVTIPGGGGGGGINIGGNITPVTMAGGTSTISLQSSESQGSVGGILDNTKSILTATNIILSDGVKGIGTGAIGSAANYVFTQSANTAIPLNLSITNAGSSFVQNTGSVSINNSTAGNGGQFNLRATPDGTTGSGQIIIAGTVKAAVGLIDIINLNSSEQAGVGGIVQSKGGLIANTVRLADNEYAAGAGQGQGTGNGNIGTTAKPILVTSTDLGVSTGLGNTAGNVAVTDTAKSGVVVIANSLDGNNNAFNSYVLNSSSGIYTVSDIITSSSAAGNISLHAAGSGYVIVASNVIAGGTNGTINLIASGTGSISVTNNAGLLQTDNGATSGTTGTINLTAASGGLLTVNMDTSNLNVNAGGNISVNNQASNNQNLTLVSAKEKAGFSLTTGAGLTVMPAITSATSILLRAGIGANGSINIDNNIGGATTKSVTIDDVSAGDIVSNVTGKITPLISAINSINLGAVEGNISGASGAALKVSAPILFANNVSGTSSSNKIDLASIYAKSVTLTNSASDGNFTLTSANSLILTNLLSVNGSISVISAGPSLTTLANSIISVGASGANVAAGNSLLLEDSNVKTGTITIGAGSNIAAYVNTTTDVINIAVGTPPPLAPASAGGIPVGVTFSPLAGVSGPYFFPTQGITVTNPANIQMNSIGGGQIVFTIPSTLKASAITIDGSSSALSKTTFTADPPSSLPATQAVSNLSVTSLQLVSSFVAPPVAVMVAPKTDAIPAAATTPLGGQQSVGFSPSLTLPGQTTSPGALQSTGIGALQATLSTVRSGFSAFVRDDTDWISETEISDGKLPAVIISDLEFGISSPISSILEMQIEDSGARRDSSTVARRADVINLTRGSILFAPTIDKIIKTPFGTVTIAANSLVFAAVNSKGLTIYNLDDRHKNAVVVKTSSQSFAINPGRMLAIASNRIKSFDMINPCQMVLYRNIDNQSLASGGQAYNGEFHIPSLVSRVLPLRALVSSDNPKAKHVVGQLCKTMAILTQLNAGRGGFVQILSTPLSAMLPQ